MPQCVTVDVPVSLVREGGDITVATSPQNRPYQSPGTQLQQSSRSKRCSGAVNSAMTVKAVRRWSWSPSLLCAKCKRYTESQHN